jgi:hypothetical protein
LIPIDSEIRETSFFIFISAVLCAEWLALARAPKGVIARKSQVTIILGVAARYRRATNGSIKDDAHPDN